MKFITPSQTTPNTKTTVIGPGSAHNITTSADNFIFTIYINIHFDFYGFNPTIFYEILSASIADIFKCGPSYVIIDGFQSMSSSSTHYYDGTGSYIGNPGGTAYFGVKLTFYIIPTSISNFYSNYATFALANFASNLTQISKNHGMPQGIQFYTSEPTTDGYTLILNTSYNSVSNSDPNWLYKQLLSTVAISQTFTIALNIYFNNYLNITAPILSGSLSIYSSRLIQAICNTVLATNPTLHIYPNLLTSAAPFLSSNGYSTVINITIINDIASITSSAFNNSVYTIVVPALFGNSPASGASATSAFIAQLINVGFPNTINAYYNDQASDNNSYISPVHPINFNIANNNCTITATNSPLGAITNDNTVPNINPIYDQPVFSSLYTINLSISNGATVGTVTWSYSPSSLSGVALSGNTLTISSGSINSQIYITATATGEYNNKNAASTISFKLS